MTDDPASGTILLTAEGLSLPEIWQQLHSNAREWRDVPRNSKFYDLREMIDDSDKQVLSQLHSIPPERWQHVCYGAGWTPLGAIALSWCNGTGLQDIATAWTYCGLPVTPDPQVLRSVALSNPDTLPRLATLSEVIAASQGDGTACALMLAAVPERIKIDIAAERLTQPPPEVQPMLEYLLARTG